MTLNSTFSKIFPKPKCVIGMIALPALLGYREFPGLNSAIDRAVEDLDTLQRGGVDAVCLENDYDRPHQLTVAPEILTSFTRIATEVARHATIPVGVQVLLNDWRGSVAIAKTIDAAFVRLDFFVDRVRIQAGVIEPEPEAIIAYRKQIQAENVALFTDVQVKYSEPLESGKSLATSAQQAIAHESNGVIVSGKVTGEPPSTEDLAEVRDAAGEFPLLVGSGANPENLSSLFHYADGAIVGTALKKSMAADEKVNEQCVEKFMKAVNVIRTKM
jgi:uncharacterized protein